MKTAIIVALFIFLILLPAAFADGGVHDGVLSGTVTLLGGQYFTFSNGSVSDTAGSIKYDNRTGIPLDFMLSPSSGYFNASPGRIEGLGPNVNINKIYKVPAQGGKTTFGEGFYVDETFPFFAIADGLALYTANTTYAAFVITGAGVVGSRYVNVTISYRYNLNGSTLFADAPTSGCAKNSNETACFAAAGSGAACYWDSWLHLCNEASEGGGGNFGGGVFKETCELFDGNAPACRNTTVCVYDPSAENGLCDPRNDLDFDIDLIGLNCSVFNNQSLCNGQPHTSPLCSWNVTAQKCLENTTKTNADLPPLPAGLTSCGSAGAQLQCINLTETHFLPCRWDGAKNKCEFTFKAIFGSEGGGDISDISSEGSCGAVGGTWKTETFSFTNTYGQTQTSTDSWCEMSFGQYSKKECDDACWACEFQGDGSAWATAADARNACEGSASGICEFQQNSKAFNGKGWCEPSSKVAFGFKDCQSSCFGCFGNSSCAASGANCTWTSDPFGFDLDGNGSFDNFTDGFCDPKAIGEKKDCSKNCFACMADTQCGNSSVVGGCEWDSSLFFCKGTGTTPEVCFIPGDEDGDGLFDCADPDCGTDPACGFGSGTGKNFGIGMGSVSPETCFQHDGDANSCQGQNGTGALSMVPLCFYNQAKGWCDPIFGKEAAGDIGFNSPPVILGNDVPDDVDGNTSFLDILGFGIHDSPETMDIGIAMKNMSEFIACYKAYPANLNKSGSFYRYIDTDENTTNGCASDHNSSVKGFEYKFLHNASVRDSTNTVYNSTVDKTSAFKCVSGNWAPFSAQANFLSDMCDWGQGEGDLEQGIGNFGGIHILLIKKTDIGSPKVPIRIYVSTANETGSLTDSLGPTYYTPGSIDTKFEDCSATGQDLDGDGLTAENDPDCQKFIKLGYVPFEGGPACKDGIDNDGNGLTDCSDTTCKYDPFSGCGQGLTCDATDKTAPQVKWNEVNKFPDGAHIAFDSNEPANGTVLFYNLSGSCTVLNATIKDLALLDSFTSNDYSPWHDADLVRNTLGFDLNANTTYYYKYKMCDLCGNCMISQCSNFTTGMTFKTFIFKPTLPEGITVSIPNLSIINNSFAFGKKLNQSKTKNLDIVVNDTNNSVGITLQNCSISSAFNINLSGAFVYNATTSGAGMDTDKWYEISQALGCKYIKIDLPATGNQLWHCDEDNVSNCYEVTSSVDCTFGATKTECTIPTAQGLGFSLYEPRTSSSSSGGSSSSSSSGGGGSSSGSSSSSGGGGVPLTTPAAKKSQVWASLAAGTTTMKIGSAEISFTEVGFTLRVENKNVEITVQKEDGKPASVTKLPANRAVYQYLSIGKKNVQEADVSGAALSFAVPKSWVAEQKAKAADVVLLRYSDETAAWAELSTRQTGSDAANYLYDAVSPGLSVFAVAAKTTPAAAAPAAPQETPVAAEPQQEALPEQQQPQPQTPSSPLPRQPPYRAVLYILVPILAAIGAFLYMRRRKAASG